MSRSNYTEEEDYGGQFAMWRGQVASAIRGRRGQMFLRELLEALDAMPDKRLIAHDLRKDGEVCALGSIGAKRGVNLEALDPYEYDALSTVFNIAAPLVREIEYVNDEAGWEATPEKRWQVVRDWVVENIKTEPKP